MPYSDSILLTHSRNPLAVFAPQPVGVSFENQENGEKIILLLRAHLITLVPSVLGILILACVPLVVSPLLSYIDVDVFLVLSAKQVFWLVLCWYLFTFGFALYKFIFWYFNVYIVTNERIVDFNFTGILHKETSYANLNQIQDVTPKVIGFFGTFFHFGNVFVQTAAERPEFEFINVARPDDVVREILEQVRKEEAEAPGEIA